MGHVEWVQTALDELTMIWMRANSSLRQEITAAAHQIDQQLLTNPHEQGESRSEGRRIHFFYPLGFSFRVEPDEQAVTVLHIWQFHRRVR